MARLDANQRNHMKSSTFGLPGKRAYPMPDKNHARLAKAMAAKYASPSERAQIDAKADRILGGTVHHKPGCGGNHMGSC